MYQIMAQTRFTEPPNLKSCRLFISAGAPLSEKIYTTFLGGFNAHISQLYGSSETGAISINLHSKQDNYLTVGTALHGIDIKIQDDSGDPMADGEEGEIWINSPAMTLKYDNMPSITRECFVDDWFFSGDLGNKSDGFLSITGRKKLLINVAGNKVDPLEIEQVLEGHQDIHEAIVIGKPHEIYGEQIKAYIVAAKDAAPTESDILGFVKTRMVEYKVPKVFEFIDEIPRSPLGKVLRKYL
jgi:long-chain acyl-CoA synthetase